MCLFNLHNWYCAINLTSYFFLLNIRPFRPNYVALNDLILLLNSGIPIYVYFTFYLLLTDEHLDCHQIFAITEKINCCNEPNILCTFKLSLGSVSTHGITGSVGYILPVCFLKCCSRFIFPLAVHEGS